MIYSNIKAQSLAELAVLGSLLLVVLAFLVRYGLSFIYQQEADMRTFRKTLAIAIDAQQRTDAIRREVLLPTTAGRKAGAGGGVTAIAVDHKHIPNPGDPMGIGSLDPVNSQADVVWGTTLNDDYEDITDLPNVDYIINDEQITLTTAGYWVISQATGYIGFFADHPITGVRELITWADTRAYKNDPDDTDEIPKILAKFPSDDTIDLIYQVAGSMTGPLMMVTRADPLTLAHKDHVTALVLLTPGEGDIDPRFMALGADTDGDLVPDVTQAQVQGLTYDNQMVTNRGDSTTITENSAVGWQSTDNVNTSLVATQTIKGNPGRITGAAGTRISEIRIISDVDVTSGAKDWQTN